MAQLSLTILIIERLTETGEPTPVSLALAADIVQLCARQAKACSIMAVDVLYKAERELRNAAEQSADVE